MSWIIVLIALAAGAANPFQSGSNAELEAHAHQALWTTAWVYASGLAGVVLLQVFARPASPSKHWCISPQTQVDEAGPASGSKSAL